MDRSTCLLRVAGSARGGGTAESGQEWFASCSYWQGLYTQQHCGAYQREAVEPGGCPEPVYCTRSIEETNFRT